MSAFTYNEALSTSRDYLRFKIGDTQTAYRKFYDEELDEILSEEADVNAARARCFRVLAHDPDRLMNTKDGTAGAFTLLSLMQLYAKRAQEWASS